MPRFNRRAPEGQNSGNGNRRTMCQRTDHSTFSEVRSGRGNGRGLCQGPPAWQNMPPVDAPVKMDNSTTNKMSPDLELKDLKQQYETAQALLQHLNAKIDAIQASIK